MSTEIVPAYVSDLADQMAYSKAVAAGSLLPDIYRDKPANVLIAIGLGAPMGLSPAESLYRINVIKGKPSAAAELIAANVRKAGHKLRMKSDDKTYATVTIVRADDPDHPFVVTRDLEWARTMGLLSQDNYKKQPGTMLQWRAISACARLACSEALYGVGHTPDELNDITDTSEVISTTSPGRSGAARLATAVGLKSEPVDAEEVPDPAGGADAPADEAEVVSVAADDDAPASDLGTGETITAEQSKKLHATFGDLRMTDRDDKLAYASAVVGRRVESSSELTKAEASKLIESLVTDVEQMKARES